MSTTFYKFYRHFDKRISKGESKRILENEITSEKVISHSFYPFIRYQKIKRVTKRDGHTVHIDSTGRRVIFKASHQDSLIFEKYKDILSAKYESKLIENDLDKNVTAFRIIKDELNKTKTNISFANDAFEAIKAMGSGTILVLDIKHFFDSIDASILKSKWKNILGTLELPEDHYQIFKILTKASYVDELELTKRFPKHENQNEVCSKKAFKEIVCGHNLIKRIDLGLPQGISLSGLLSNVYLLDFDIAMKKIVSTNQGHYVRYCDDLFFVFKNDVPNLIDEIESELAKLKLKLNPEKIQRATFSTKDNRCTVEPRIQYLGFYFNGEQKWIRQKSIIKYINASRRAIRAAIKTREKRNKFKETKGLIKREALYKKSLYQKFLNKNKFNLIGYADRAAKEMNSPTILHQTRRLKNKFLKALAEADN